MASKPPNPRLCTVPKAVCRQYARHLLDLAKGKRFSPAEREELERMARQWQQWADEKAPENP